MKNLKNILIVDDNPENLKVVSNFLKEKGYNLALALNGEDALNILGKNKIDLILLDIMMPIISGIEVCKILKDDPAKKDIPVIFLTAKNQIEDITEGFNAGGVDYLTKPFNKDELLVRIKNHIELADSRNKIIEMNKTRDKIYSIIAHDLRSPLASIKLAINAISDGYIDPNSPDFKLIFSDLKDTTDNTNILLSNLLNWTRLQGNSIAHNPKPLALNNLVMDCYQLLKGNAEAKNINIEINIDESIEILVDEVSMHTIIRNLISNAIKFTPNAGKIIISCSNTALAYSLTIKDSGVGISEENLKRIFDNNELVTTNGTNKELGTGLGLMMVKDFTKKNNAILKAKSIIDKGTEISIEFPKST